jgi:cytochrome c-type biogenesis protein CcmE
VDLTPRPAPEGAVVKRRRRWLPSLVLVLVLGAGAVVVTQFLTSAIDYYCNVDEVGVKDGCDPGRRLRIQGVVDEGSVQNDGVVTSFTVSFNGAQMPVRYDGEPGGIFKECIPVVVHGVVESGVFLGDRIEVKHSNEYVADNPDRVDEEAYDSTEESACSQSV